VDLALASVTAAGHAVAVGEFVDRSLDSGADCVAGLPLGCLLLDTDAELQVAYFAWGESPRCGGLRGRRCTERGPGMADTGSW
jgi:hypothetical protein